MNDDELREVLDRDNYEFWAQFARRPGGARGVDDGSIWYRSGVPSTSYNGVLGGGADVGTMLDRVRSWGVPARWLVNGTTDAALEASFTEHGFAVVDESTGMAVQIADLPEPVSGLTVEVVREDTQHYEWCDVFRDAFGLPSDLAAHVYEAHAWPRRFEEARTYLLIRLEGVPVATGLLHSACGVAGIYGIAVRRAFRRRGFGALATLLTVREGTRRGATVAVLQATAEGFPVYARLGFRALCSFRSWKIV